MERMCSAIDKEFASADELAKTMAQAATEALRKNDFEKGAASLLTLQNLQGLTTPQSQAVYFAIRQVQIDATQASANGDPRGDKGLEVLRGGGRR